MKRINILLFTCLILIATPCFATIRCVSLDGWTSAPGTLYTTISAALSAVNSSDDEVWIKGYTDGTTYPENLTIDSNHSGISIRGGYTGNGSERNESYITTVFPTSGPVITVSNIPASPTTLIEYLTIKNSRSSTTGGISCVSASPIIQHCHICYCNADSVGGMCADYYSSPTIEDCEIDNNVLDGGQAAVLMYNGIFRRNKLHDNNNIAGSNGGLSVGCYGSGTIISDNHIYSNSAASAGGGIYLAGSPVTLTGNIVENNIAYYGHAIYWSKGAASGGMSNNVIKGNSGIGASAVYIDTTASTSFVNNTIIGNTGDGSFRPVEISGGALDLYNNIIANNSNYGIFTSGTIGCSYNNCLYGNSTDDYNVTPSDSQNPVTSSPSFDTDGYHLVSSSNCFNAGYNTAPGIPATDLDGDTRTLYSVVDIGADEYVDVLPPSPGTASSPTFSSGATAIQVDYTGASDDASGLKEVVLWYREGVHGAWTDSGFTQTGASGSFSFSPTKQTTYYFDLVAEDNAGNMSSAAAGDGDCQTICQTDLSSNASGHAFIHNEYLYPGGPKVRVSAYDDQGSEYRQTTITYGSEGEVVSQSGSAESVGYTYDAVYRVKTISDGKSQTTTYTYDLNNNLTSVELPGGDTIQYPEHDPLGNVLERIDPNGVTTEYTYDDPESLLTDIHYPASSSLDVHYDYDSTYGRLTAVQDGTGTTAYGYDDLDLVISKTTTYTSLPARTIEYSFWPDGSLETLTTPAGDFDYTYNADGLPTGLTNPSSESFSWGYNTNDWLQQQSSPVSVSTFGYNSRGFLTSLTNKKTDLTLLSEFSGTSGMAYDTVGNLLSVSVNIPSSSALSGSTQYSYNNKDQLEQEYSSRNSGFTNNFVYDAAGNPTTFRGTTRSFNSRNQNTAFAFDYNGNPTTYKSNTLTYDPENNLTGYGSAMSAAYTSSGLRAWKESGSTRTYFLYVGGNPVCEIDSSGSVVAVNTFGPTGLLSRRENTTSTFYTYDPQGSVVQTLDSSANTTSTQLYDAYGNLLSGTATEPYGYGARHGYYTDSETDLQLLTHRYYDPEEGRFLTRDPIGYAGGMNLYGYVSNNPVNAIDPLGFCGEGGESGGGPIASSRPGIAGGAGVAGVATTGGGPTTGVGPGTSGGLAISGSTATGGQNHDKSWFEQAWDWYAYESVVPGPYGQPMSEWGPNGPLSWGDLMKYTDEAGGGWKWTERTVVYGTATLAAITLGAGIAEMAGLIDTAPQANNIIRVISKVGKWGARLDKPHHGKPIHFHFWKW